MDSDSRGLRTCAGGVGTARERSKGGKGDTLNNKEFLEIEEKIV